MVVTVQIVDGTNYRSAWSQISAQKPNIELINPNSKKMFFVAPVVNSKSTVYVFQLIVKDPNGGSDSANVKVNVVQKQVPSVKQQHKVDATSRLSGTRINHQQNQPKPSNKINRKEITLNNNTVSHPTIFQGQAHILKDQEDVARKQLTKLSIQLRVDGDDLCHTGCRMPSRQKRNRQNLQLILTLAFQVKEQSIP